MTTVGIKKPQLDMKRKREMAMDLNKGMSESEDVKKYNTSKGTVGRVRSDMEMLLGMDPEQMKSGVKRQRRVKYEQIDIFVSDYVRRCREHNCIVTGPILYYAMLQKVLRKRICTLTNRNSAHHKDGLKSSRKETISFGRFCKEKELLPQS